MIYHGNSIDVLLQFEDNSVDLLITDPPYSIAFMGADWDKALPDIEIWKQCLRVLKPGALAFVMSIPRMDCLCRVGIALEDAGFRVDFSPIYWAFSSGFPKAVNISKSVDRKLGAEREVVGSKITGNAKQRTNATGEFANGSGINQGTQLVDVTVPASPQAKALDGSYGGFSPKPAVEVIIVAMKPMSEKTFVGQALSNRKGITWLDDGRIPYESEGDRVSATPQGKCTGQVYDSMLGRERKEFNRSEQRGRFPANLIVSGNVLDDGKGHSGVSGGIFEGKGLFPIEHQPVSYNDGVGSFSRYFDIDKWWEEKLSQLPENVRRTFPFLITPKSSQSERHERIDGSWSEADERFVRNGHPTVKPVKLMSYLITLGSREGDVVLDPFLGSGTTAVACQLSGRECIGIELKEKYYKIAQQRCSQTVLIGQVA